MAVRVEGRGGHVKMGKCRRVEGGVKDVEYFWWRERGLGRIRRGRRRRGIRTAKGGGGGDCVQDAENGGGKLEVRKGLVNG